MEFKTKIPLFREFSEIHKALGLPYKSDFSEINLFNYQDSNSCSDKIEPYRINFYQFFFIYNSEFTGNYNNTTITFLPQHSYLFFTCPGKLISWEKSGNVNGHIFSFKASFLIPFISVSEFLTRFNFFNAAANKPLLLKNQCEIELVRGIFGAISSEYYKRSPESSEIIFHEVIVFLIKIKKLIFEMDGAGIAEMKNGNRAGKLFSDFEKLVRKNLTIKETIVTYAGLLNVTAKYLSETLKKPSGKSGRQIIIDIVVLEATSLLIQTDLSVAEISYRFGFTDPSYFSKLFKKKTGKTPLQYRKRSSLYFFSSLLYNPKTNSSDNFAEHEEITD